MGVAGPARDDLSLSESNIIFVMFLCCSRPVYKQEEHSSMCAIRDKFSDSLSLCLQNRDDAD